MEKSKISEFTLRISQANKTDLIVILYEICEYYIDEAIQSINCDNQTQFYNSVRLSRACIDELLRSLNLRYEIARNLQEIYIHINGELSKIVYGNIDILLRIKNMIATLRVSYEKIREQDDSEPLMDNAQMVKAGMTYGRTDINVDVMDQGSSRGYRI